jgi:predicted esterase
VVLLCLSGVPLRKSDPDGGAYFPNHFELRDELSAALAALQEHPLYFRLLPERAFLGYSQGATMGALAVVGEHEFASLVLIEGGAENWTQGRARSFRGNGGKRVLLVCGTPGCKAHAERSVPVLLAADLASEAEFVEGAGHTYVGAVAETVWQKLLSWGYGSDPHD